MSDCGCQPADPETAGQRRVLIIALGLNTAMFVVGLAAGLIGQSSGLLADSLDMLTDATAYAIALAAISRGALFKARAARLSGSIMLVLGVGVLADVVRRGVFGSDPASLLMIGVATLSLVVNVTVLRMLGRLRGDGVHLNASWICTRADVVANIGVIASGLILTFTGFRFADLIVGAGIGLYVLKEAAEILRQAEKAANVAQPP